MPVSLLHSQLATLEALHADEGGFEIDSSLPVGVVVDAIIGRLDDRVPGNPAAPRL